MFILIYLKGRVTGGREGDREGRGGESWEGKKGKETARELASICWFSPQRPAAARTEPRQSREAGTPWQAFQVAGTHPLESPSAATQDGLAGGKSRSSLGSNQKSNMVFGYPKCQLNPLWERPCFNTVLLWVKYLLAVPLKYTSWMGSWIGLYLRNLFYHTSRTRGSRNQPILVGRRWLYLLLLLL